MKKLMWIQFKTNNWKYNLLAERIYTEDTLAKMVEHIKSNLSLEIERELSQEWQKTSSILKQSLQHKLSEAFVVYKELSSAKAYKAQSIKQKEELLCCIREWKYEILYDE